MYNWQRRGAMDAYETEKAAYTAAKELQGKAIPYMRCYGVLAHTAIPVIVTNVVGTPLSEGKSVPRKQQSTIRAALKALHDAGIAHGYVCRENVLVSESGKVFLVDLSDAVVGAAKPQLKGNNRM